MRSELLRLRFRAERSVGKVRITAYQDLLARLKMSETYVGIYLKLYEDIEIELLDELGPDYALDTIYVNESNSANASRLDALETQLARVKLTSNKESIRLAHMDISSFLYQIGRLVEAQKLLMKCKEYCTLPSHHADLYLACISIFMELRDWKQAQTYLSRADGIVEMESDEFFTTKLNMFKGLICLAELKYREASRYFLKIRGDGEYMRAIQEGVAFLLSPQDVAAFAVSAALASFTRKELRESIIENQSFKPIVQTHSVVNDLVLHFYSKAYNEVFSELEQVLAEMSVDLYFHAHVSSVRTAATERSIIEYLAPYESADLTKMSIAFGIELQNILARLISSGAIAARIDGHSNTLWKYQPTPKTRTVDKVVALTRSHGRDIRKGILRLSLIEEGLSVSSKEAVSLSLVKTEVEESEDQSRAIAEEAANLHSVPQLGAAMDVDSDDNEASSL